MTGPNHKAGMAQPNPKGMTLVELLVVVSIIAVLTAISAVGIAKGISAARATACSSNLRQIGAAIIAYATENNGQLPPLEDRTGASDGLKRIWPQIIADGGYLERAPDRKGELTCGAGVWACPECTTAQTNYNGYGGAEGTVMQVKRLSLPGSGSLRLSAISQPEKTWLVGDTTTHPSAPKAGWYAIWADPNQWKSDHSPAARHGGKVNVVMVDGHVERLTIQELNAKDYTLMR